MVVSSCRRAATSVTVLAAVFAAGCRASHPPQPVELDDEPPPPPASNAPPLAATRCVRAEPLSAGEPLARLEVGESVLGKDVAAAGVTYERDGKRLAGIVAVSATTRKVTVTELGPAVGDRPPPAPMFVGSELFALVQTADANTANALVRIARDGVKRLASVPRPGGASAATAALGPTGGILAWDADAADRGVIEVAVLTADRSGVASRHAVSPNATDAESSRVALKTGGGYWIAWIARKSVAPPPPGRELRLEGAGEDLAYQWVELLELDAQGKPVGAPRALTAPTGHVSAFELTTRSEEVVAVLRDDAAQGGHVRSIAAKSGSVETAAELARGLGHGLFELVRGADGAQFLSFADGQDRPSLIPLSDSRRGAGLPSVEPLLDGARPMAVLGAPVTVSGTAKWPLLVAFPADTQAPLQVLLCGS